MGSFFASESHTLGDVLDGLRTSSVCWKLKNPFAEMRWSRAFFRPCRFDQTAPCFSFRAKAEKKVLASRIASCMPQLIWFGAGEVPLARKPVFAVRVQRTTLARVSSVCPALLRRRHFALFVQQAVLLRNGTF